MHHAYLLTGSKEHALAYVESLVGNVKGSPDFFPYSEPVFGIAEARKLSEQALRKAFTGKKVFLLIPLTITPEAQNALLKTFEDPVPETHFFLLVREASIILPTLRSRMRLVSLKAGEEEGEAEKFLKMPLKKRLVFAKDFADEERNLPAFLDSLLLAVRGRGDRQQAGSTFKMRLVADQRAAAPRLVLEHLASLL